MRKKKKYISSKKGARKKRAKRVKGKAKVKKITVLKKKSPRKKGKTLKAKQSKKGPELPGEPIGRVTHYFPQVKATAVLIERDKLRTGDTLYFKGHTTAFKQRVDSLQIDRAPVAEAEPGQEVGIRVKARTREHDQVFKI